MSIHMNRLPQKKERIRIQDRHLSVAVVLLDNPNLFSSSGDHINRTFDLTGLMCGGDRGAQSRQTFRNRGRDHWQNKYIVVLGLARHRKGLFIGTAQYRDNGSRGQQSIEARGLESVDEQLRIVIQFLDAPRFLEDHFEGFIGSGGLSGWKRGGKNICAAGMTKIIDQILFASDVSADGGNRFAQRAHLDAIADHSLL